MPLIVQEAAQPRCPRDFALALAPVQGDPLEQRCRDRVNEYVNYLASLPGLDTPRGQELVNLRDRYVGLLHDRADEVVANALTAEELLYTRYVYQGQFEVEVKRLVVAVFFVSSAPKQDGLPRVDFDISQGTTTPKQADLVRSIKAAETVVDVVLKRPLLGFAMPWKVIQWRARRDYYVAQLADIGRIGLTEGNMELAEGNLRSLEEAFLAQQAEAVKNRYLRRLGFWALLWIVVNVVVYVLVYRFFAPAARAAMIDGSYFFLADIAWRFRNFLLLAIGAAFGAWLAFLIQRPTLRFSDLVQLDENLLRPAMRVVFTIVLGTVIGLLFWTGMVLINIGGFSTNFHDAGTPAMLIGAFCGIASGAMVAALADRAREFAQTVGGQAERRPAPGG